MEISIRVVAFLILCCCVPPVADAEQRIALVIGNSNYTLAPLRNPKNDANDLAMALRRLNFVVIEREDLTVAAFDDTLDNFVERAKGADVALFFFSGHGLQIDKRGFLAPVDVKVESESRALRELVAIQEVVSRIEHAAKVSVVLLDACRDSPLQERLRRVAQEKNKALIPSKGLPLVNVVGSNTLVVYATVPGETASDGAGRNSPFTDALLKHIETPGLEVELMFKRVTADVLRETNGKQQPERLSRLQNELVFLTSGKPEGGAAKSASPALQYEDEARHLVRTFKPEGAPSSALDIAFSKDGRNITASGSRLHVWDASTGQRIQTLAFSHARMSTAALSHDGKLALTGAFEPLPSVDDFNAGKLPTNGGIAQKQTYDDLLKLWDVSTGRELHSFKDFSSSIGAAAFSIDGKLAAATTDDEVIIWETTAWTVIDRIKFRAYIKSVAFSPDARYLLVGGGQTGETFDKGFVILWDIKEKQKLDYSDIDGLISKVAFPPFSAYVLAGGNGKIESDVGGCSNGTILTWKRDSFMSDRKFKGHINCVSAVVYLSDGRYIATGSSDNTVIIWDLRTSAEVGRLVGHSSRVTALALSPDSRILASGAEDGIVKLWDVAEWTGPREARQ